MKIECAYDVLNELREGRAIVTWWLGEPAANDVLIEKWCEEARHALETATYWRRYHKSSPTEAEYRRALTLCCTPASEPSR